MCTLTYLPTGKNSFIWTQNRDESPLRTSSGLVRSSNDEWVYPKEPLSGGTWMGITQDGRVVSLLNGAFKRNQYVPSIKSRGIMVLEFLASSSLATFVTSYNFNDIEPFTMMVYEHSGFWELRWDKTKTYLKELDTQQPYIWSSSMLYLPSIKALRRTWFATYLKEHPIPNQESILSFHRNAGIGDPQNDLIMDRGMVKTVSITNIVRTEKSVRMTYYDLINDGTTMDELIYG